MKILIIKKKNILYISFIILAISILSIFAYNILHRNSNSITTFNPIDNSSPTLIDLTGDSTKDTLKVITNNGNIDVQISYNNHIFSLSNLCDDSILLSDTSYWPIKIYIKNLSKSIIPQIIIQGVKNNTPTQYIFTWDNGKFVKLSSTNKNIFGILDFSTTRTPQFYSLNSFTGTSSINSSMLINNELIDVTKDCNKLPDLSEVISLIDIIQKNYEVDEIPDIFTQNISEQELGLLWNLDKEHNSYSFQDAFFYDSDCDNEGNFTSLKWRLTFEKYIKEKSDTEKSQIVFYVTTQRNNNEYRISSFYAK